jgi:glycosyltransferase involved in cell wall biosynthesis
MTDRPLLSVVIATRNRADLLARALDSVLSQTVPQLEVLVVDDASEDETGAVARELHSHDPRIRYLRLPVPAGAPVARNLGLTLSRSEWVTFSDDDCFWPERRLEEMLDFMLSSGPDVAMLYGPATSDDIGMGVTRLNPQPHPSKYLGPWPVGTPAAFVRRDVAVKVGGFDPLMPRLQDFDLWIRLLANHGFRYVPVEQFRTVRHADGISNQDDRLNRAGAILLHKYRDGSIPAVDRIALHRMLGHLLMINGQATLGRKHLLAAWRLSPFSPLLAFGASAALAGERAYRFGHGIRERFLSDPNTGRSPEGQ